MASFEDFLHIFRQYELHYTEIQDLFADATLHVECK